MGSIRFRLAVVLLSCYAIIYGFSAEGRSLSTEVELEVERELRLLNKHTVQTIKTEHGDIYNCVDLYNQPALHHPLLKDHKIQLQPTFGADMATKHFLKDSSKNISVSPIVSHTIKIGLENGCPNGTVPIRKTTKDQLLRAKSTFKRLHKDGFSIKDAEVSYQFAGYLTDRKQVHSVGATSAYINIYNPGPVQNGQYSCARINIRTGGPSQMDKIEVGWTVNPDLYGDNRTRLFTLWSADNIEKSGCYNALCPGFVIVNPNLPLDTPIPHISQILGVQYDAKFTLTQDTLKNWWLMVNEDNVQLGYWPSKLFSSLKNGADQVVWGGEVYSMSSEFPPMGSGVFDFKNYQKDCYFRRVQTTTYHQHDEPPVHVGEFGHYYARDASNKGDYWGFSFVFGGEAGGKSNTAFGLKK